MRESLASANAITLTRSLSREFFASWLSLKSFSVRSAATVAPFVGEGVSAMERLRLCFDGLETLVGGDADDDDADDIYYLLICLLILCRNDSAIILFPRI